MRYLDRLITMSDIDYLKEQVCVNEESKASSGSGFLSRFFS